MSSIIKKIKDAVLPLFSKRAFVLPLVGAITLLCVAASLSSVNTYIVYENDDIKVFNSSVKTSSEALAEMNISINDHDLVEMQDEPEDGVAKIYIYRKKALNINDGGTASVIYANKEQTLNDVFKNNNITLSDTDTVSVSLSTPVTDGMQVVITRIVHSTVEETVEIPFKTEKRANASMNEKTSKVVQKGVKGSKKLVYDVETINGKESSRALSGETVITQPVTKIIEYGTKKVKKAAPAAATTVSGKNIKYKKVLTMTATAYTTERSSHKITASGRRAAVGLIAVDPRVIPLGTKLYIEGANGKWAYGTAVAADTGSAIRGNIIDLYFNTYRECVNFGRRKVKVYILE